MVQKAKALESEAQDFLLDQFREDLAREEQRKDTLESKALTLSSFSGLIISVLGGLLMVGTSTLQGPCLVFCANIVVLILYLASILFFVLTAILSLRVIWLQAYLSPRFPYSSGELESKAKEGATEFKWKRLILYEESLKSFEVNNKKKAQLLRNAFLTLLAGMVLIVLAAGVLALATFAGILPSP
jgi:hypothetical protein